MLTTQKPVVGFVKGSSRKKAFVCYGDPIGVKNLCVMGIRQVLPNLKLDVLESKQIELLATELWNARTPMRHLPPSGGGGDSGGNRKRTECK